MLTLLILDHWINELVPTTDYDFIKDNIADWLSKITKSKHQQFIECNVRNVECMQMKDSG